jgi:hypothetical protein
MTTVGSKGWPWDTPASKPSQPLTAQGVFWAVF